jgi:hypothetical protein
MKSLAAFFVTASLVLAFFITADTRAFAQNGNVDVSAWIAQDQGDVARVQEEVTVTTPKLTIKGSPRDHFFTFDAPVAIPGVTLAPGAYIFRRPIETNGHIVQILSADRRHVYAMYDMWPAYRSKITGRDAVVFGQASAGFPKPLLQYFSHNESLGYTFPWKKTGGVEVHELLGN